MYSYAHIWAHIFIYEFTAEKYLHPAIKKSQTFFESERQSKASIARAKKEIIAFEISIVIQPATIKCYSRDVKCELNHHPVPLIHWHRAICPRREGSDVR